MCHGASYIVCRVGVRVGYSQPFYGHERWRQVVRFCSTKELRTTTELVLDQLSRDGEVVITKNGRPAAVMIDIADGNWEETVRAVRQAKARTAFTVLHKQAAEQGYFSEREIEDEIRAVRAAKKA